MATNVGLGGIVLKTRRLPELTSPADESLGYHEVRRYERTPIHQGAKAVGSGAARGDASCDGGTPARARSRARSAESVVGVADFADYFGGAGVCGIRADSGGEGAERG